MTERADNTQSVEGEHRAAGVTAQPFLFLVMQANQPLSSSVRVPLHQVTQVRLGRDSVRSMSAAADGTLELGLPDRGVSSAHARLTRTPTGWTLEDLGSKNGTWVNGERVEGVVPLADGDWLELGSTFLRLRTALDAAGLLDTAVHPPAAPGLLTLLPAGAGDLEKLARLAPTRLPVLLVGESGVGKEVIARAVHTLSYRPGPFVAVNCGGLSPTLIESELFGYRKGAFSGALEDRPGLVRTSDHGTLFLDEVGDLPAVAQATLLRVLQESEVVPVGGTRPVKVDLRLVAATHRELGAMVAQGLFRADLLARLSGFLLRLPPLRNRREDLGWIIAALLRRHASEPASVSFSVEATRLLLTHAWPLNVRELEKALLAAVTLAAGGQVERAHLPERLGAAPAVPALDAEDQALRAQLVGLFEAHAGNVSAVAEAMGKARFQIQRWMKRLQIDPATFRK